MTNRNYQISQNSRYFIR